MLDIKTVDVVEHRRDCRTFSRTGNTRQQDHALIKVTKRFHHGRQVQPFEVGNKVVDSSSDQPHLSQLLKHIDTETPIDTIDFDDVRKVGTAFFLENLLVTIVQHRQQQSNHLLGSDRIAVERLECAIDATERRSPDLHVKIASLQFDECPKVLVDRNALPFFAELIAKLLVE